MSSSAHIAKGTPGAVTHNSRETFSHSVVFPDEKNEIENNAKVAFSIYRKELAPRMQAYEERTKQSLQKSTSTHLSCVINLQQHHTLKDLEGIKKYIEETFDTKVFQMAIHRDEGKLVSKEDEKEIYTSGVDFFKCPKTNKLFWDKKYSKEVDMYQYDIVKNYHAHLEFVGLDSKGNSIKRNYLSKYNLSKLQTVVAQELKMQRGKNYYESGEKAPKRLDVLEFKRANTSKRENTQELKARYEEERAVLKASGTATQQDYQALKAKYEHYKILYETNSKTVETYKTLYASANERADRAEAREVVKEVEKVVEVEKEKIVEVEKEKIVRIEDTTRITELETALKSTNDTLSSVQSALSSQNANMTTLALAIESSTEYKRDIYKEQHFDFIKRVVSSLVEKVQSLSKQISSLLSETKSEALPPVDPVVATPTVEEKADVSEKGNSDISDIADFLATYKKGSSDPSLS